MLKYSKLSIDEYKVLRISKCLGNTIKRRITQSMNQTETEWNNIDFACNRKNSMDQIFNLKITSWNVSGLKAWIRKDGLKILQYNEPDIFCIQETKCKLEHLPSEITSLEGYQQFWCSSFRSRYSGVALLTKLQPHAVDYGIGSKEHDEEGRCITVEYEKFYLVCVYVPNSGHGLKTLSKREMWNLSFKNYITSLDKKKPVVICGDFNVAHKEIDLANPKSNIKTAGFTKGEREAMTEFLANGFVDTFRDLYPEKRDVYTFWSYFSNSRARNIGWRLDYFIVSKQLKYSICDSVIHSKVFGSDHCPISLYINI